MPALVLPQRMEQHGIDIAQIELRAVALDQRLQVDAVPGFGELAGPDDVHGDQVVALRVADEVGRDLGQQLRVAQDVDPDVEAQILLRPRHQLDQHARELVVLRGEIEAHALEALPLGRGTACTGHEHQGGCRR